MTFTVRATWWGHATVWLEDSGVRLLTDPLLGDRLAHLRRVRGPRPDLPGTPDAVLVSHLHADHLDIASLRRLPAETTLVVPAGAAAFIHQRLGPIYSAHCIELEPGAETTVRGVRIRAVPAAHDGGRGPWSKFRAAAVGYLVEGAARTWFAGDTGLFDEMPALGPVDLALVPVGGWGPTLGAGHLDAVAGAEAARRVAARWAVPIHFGTFWPVGMGRIRPHLFHEPGRQFVAHARSVASRTQTRVLQQGETLAVEAAP